MKVVHRFMSLVTLTGLPRPLQLGIYGLAGVAVGLALVLVRIANATSYLSDDPQACINCHVMTDAYASSQRGSHGRVAVSTDCHVPHTNLVAKYAFKAEDGLKHSYVFTLRKEPQVLELSARAVPVVQANCGNCHSHQVMMIGAAWREDPALAPPSPPGHPGRVERGPEGPATQGQAGLPNGKDRVWGGDALGTTVPQRRCWDCHQEIHGRARSLSASPVSLRPGLPDAGLAWMKKGDQR
jgi:cytochrome c nitrite reductase small subunit